jgi:hypothetical protein
MENQDIELISLDGLDNQAGGLGDELWEEELQLWASMNVEEMIRNYIRTESAKSAFNPDEVVRRVVAWRSKKHWCIKKLQSLQRK